MNKLRSVEKEKPAPLGYYAGFALEVLRSREALCGLTFFLVVGTICALALHEYGIDVMPRARAAALEAQTTPHP